MKINLKVLYVSGNFIYDKDPKILKLGSFDMFLYF